TAASAAKQEPATSGQARRERRGLGWIILKFSGFEKMTRNLSKQNRPWQQPFHLNPRILHSAPDNPKSKILRSIPPPAPRPGHCVVKPKRRSQSRFRTPIGAIGPQRLTPSA